ncbi:sodium-coupled monocarboxylate transporter 1-like [Amphiura filiformis]|uniref:sodium-coupled monocarboxylate transporter 1-like n=1 Tax=Amphiura filiformis TaxID=82378 RepID=UPI003B210507
MENETSFSTADYVVFAIVLLFSSGIGIYYAFCGGRQKTSGEFLMADRSMGFFPVAMSLIASLFTGIYIQGVTADVYFRGTMFWWNVIPQALTCWIAGRCFLPIYFRLGLTSIYEYLELRFSTSIRNVGVIICYFFMILHSGVATFAASLALKAVTGIELTPAVLILSGVCMFYTALGGMKAVLWADCFQMFIVFAGLFCAIIEGALTVGGLKEVWRIAEDNGRIIFDNWDPAEYATFWNIAIFGAVGWLPAQAISQYQIQRYLSCKDFRTANLALTTYAIGCMIVTSLCCLAGLCIFAYYSGCDPYSAGDITFRDEILPFFIVNTMQRFPGLSGLLIAGLCCLALSVQTYSGINVLALIILFYKYSTVSSVENALTAVTGQHFIKGFWPNISEATYTLINKGLVLLFGVIIIGATFLMSIMGDLVPTLLGIIGVTNSPILGVFCLGIFSKRTTSKGAWIGFIVSVAVGMWILIGSLHYPSPPKSLSLTIDECPNDDYVYNATTVVYTFVTEWFNVSTTESIQEEWSV